MNPIALNPVELGRRLAEGWSADRPETPRELLARLCARWHANSDREWCGRSSYRCAVELDHVRLHGVSELGCLVLGGGADGAAEQEAFWRELGGAGRLGLVLAASPELAVLARRSGGAKRCIFLGPVEVQAMLAEPHALEQLKRSLRAQLPRGVLLAYDITHPAPPNMFFGRAGILSRMHRDDTTSFAIAGPGRIGKSSILRQYIHELRREAPERFKRVRLIDCYAYAQFDADAFARRIALEFSADSTANRVNQATLLHYMKVISRGAREPVELLFDEVDLVCENAAFLKVAEAVKEGYCRVMLCGKGMLHKMMRSHDNPLASRLELLLPEPLDPAAAGQLLLEPLLDAGFSVENHPAMQEEVFALTGRVPHLVQACARQMALLALQEEQDVITHVHFDRVRAEFDQLRFSSLPLDSLADDGTRLAALLLIRRGCGKVIANQLQELIAREGVEFSLGQIINTCYDLWICHLLTFEGGVFTLGNASLVEFFRRQGVLVTEIARLGRLLAPSRQLATAS